MKAKEKLEWLYKGQIANTPLMFRRDFEVWWKEVCKNIDKLIERERKK